MRFRFAGRADRPDRIEVAALDGKSSHSWPLPVRARPGALQVARGLAAFLERDGTGLWVMRLKDGKTTFIAPVHPGDRPLLDASGMAYQDNVYKRRPLDQPLLKFVPTSSLQQEVGRAIRPLHTDGAIRAFSVDGTRVALAVGSRAGRCDRVVFWNAPWRSVEQVSEDAGPTCEPLGASRRISSIALGGLHAQWVTHHRGRPMLVAADAIGCKEWVIRRLSDAGAGTELSGIAADGRTLAFALVDRSQRAAWSDIDVVTRAYRERSVFRVTGAVRSISADARRIAVLSADGSVQTRTTKGRLLQSFDVHGATSLALGGRTLVVTTRRGRLDVFSLSTAQLLHSWRLPMGSAHVDLQYGIAVVTAGHSVYAMNTMNGRIARLAVAPAAVRAQIEPIGVVYVYSRNGHGTARLISMSRVEKSMGEA